MSGHSKWKTIKHQKGAADAKRGQLFTKLTRDIMVAVKQGGGPDPDMNYKLRLAVDKARSNSMPLDNIDRAIKRASGTGDGNENLDEVLYEGYAPGGAAILVQALTSNRNRTASVVRSTFTKAGGALGESGSVAWNFEHKGLIVLELEPDKAEDVALSAIDVGADDVKVDKGYVEVYTAPENLKKVKDALEKQGIASASADLAMIPKTTISLGPKESEQALRLLDLLEELEDSQKVYTNADFPDEVLEKYKTQA
ncbi:MAG: YebC/PmpR family DNA-binding transcriptional regulator [SAR202 cluster bacterium]|nr:YebC/PmpR family DNA-binding transcriptional regulator [SAR202 cluster bacterium]